MSLGPKTKKNYANYVFEVLNVNDISNLPGYNLKQFGGHS